MLPSIFLTSRVRTLLHLHESESKRSNDIANKCVFGRFNKIFDVDPVDIEAFKLVCFDANPQF